MVIEGVEVKPIPGYEGHYGASYDGRIWSYKSNRWLKLLHESRNRPYLHVDLSKNNIQKHYYVHRAVALAWIPNPNSLPVVNHKDENPVNNCVDNLEWCDVKYNVNYGTTKERIVETLHNNPNINRVGVRCVETGEEWDSLRSCAKATGCDLSGLRRAIKNNWRCNGRHYEKVVD